MTPLLQGASLWLALSKVFRSTGFQGSRVAHFVLHSTAADLYEVASRTSLGDWWAGFLGVAKDVALDFICGKGHPVNDC
jgi:hypothetical protein